MCASEKIDFSNFLFALIIEKVITFELIRKRLTVEKENLIERGVFMKRITIVALILMLAISAGIANSSARSALPAGSELLTNLPDGRGAVVLVDVPKVLGSSLFTQGKLKSTLDKVQTELSQVGLKLSDLNYAAISFSSGKFNDPTIVVKGSFNQADLLVRAKDSGKVKIESQKYKNVDVYSVSDIKAPAAKTPNDMAFAFLDASTVVAGNAAGVRASIDARSGETANITKNVKLMEGLSQNTLSPIRFALEMTPAMTKGLTDSGLPLPNFASLQMIFGGVDLTENIALDASLRNDTADHAKEMTDQLNGLLGLVKGLMGASDDAKMAPLVAALKTLKIVNENLDVKVTASLPAEMLQQLMK
jgi:hypothetical protein